MVISGAGEARRACHMKPDHRPDMKAGIENPVEVFRR
jgi:hypothetical protein